MLLLGSGRHWIETLSIHAVLVQLKKRKMKKMKKWEMKKMKKWKMKLQVSKEFVVQHHHDSLHQLNVLRIQLEIHDHHLTQLMKQ